MNTNETAKSGEVKPPVAKPVHKEDEPTKRVTPLGADGKPIYPKAPGQVDPDTVEKINEDREQARVKRSNARGRHAQDE